MGVSPNSTYVGDRVIVEVHGKSLEGTVKAVGRWQVAVLLDGYEKSMLWVRYPDLKCVPF